jgi:hypothetical protein
VHNSSRKIDFLLLCPPLLPLKDGGVVLKRTSAAPTYILLKPTELKNAKFAHPLDTGAFSINLYKGLIDSDLQPQDFAFEPSPEQILKLIQYFYGSNEKYLLAEPRQLNIPHGNDEAQAYYDVLSDQTQTRRDIRDSSIEIALGTEISITTTTVQCIIMPDQLLDHDDYGKRIKELGEGIDVRTYRIDPNSTAESHNSRIFDTVVAYYREKKMI